MHGTEGALTLRNLTGSVDVTTMDGAVNASNLTGRVAQRTSDGSVAATGFRSDDVSASSSDGPLQLSFGSPPSSVTAHSSVGAIEVVVPADGTAYAVTANTSGESREVSVPTDPSSARRMRLSTSDGAIRVLDRT